MERKDAIGLLKKYNKEEFHIRHAYTVEAVMRYFAKEKGYDEDFWGFVGLLHDVDFEQYPDKHCQRKYLVLKRNLKTKSLLLVVQEKLSSKEQNNYVGN